MPSFPLFWGRRGIITPTKLAKNKITSATRASSGRILSPTPHLQCRSFKKFDFPSQERKAPTTGGDNRARCSPPPPAWPPAFHQKCQICFSRFYFGVETPQISLIRGPPSPLGTSPAPVAQRQPQCSADPSFPNWYWLAKSVNCQPEFQGTT